MLLKKVKIRSYEKGLVFRDREFVGLLEKGRYWFLDPLSTVRVDVVSLKTPWLYHEDLDVMVASGELENHAIVLDLKDHQRALVWIDERFDRVVGPGLHALWTGIRKVTVQVVDATDIRFDHQEISRIATSADVDQYLNIVSIDHGYEGIVFKDGAFVERLAPGRYMFWKNVGKVKFYHVDLRAAVLDVSGQEIMTADKVTLRMNAVVNYRIEDALTSISAVDDSKQALYRAAQLALRAVIGTFELDMLLKEKGAVAKDLENTLVGRAVEFGISVLSAGIRDIILPGEMKALMNRVIEARKAADANLITRREETAAMRSQANTARLLEDNPTLMRLRELDLLEKIVGNSKMNLVLGEKGLADRVINLL